MKRILLTPVLVALIATGSALMAQEQPDDYLGLPGDNLNLYAVMQLFQESETLEGFERTLNDENSRINNLDLNGDNQIDYIKVIDYPNGNVHTIVLQDVLGRNESQDVAVFTVQKFGDGSVQIQLIGDEALYGKNYIIEPIMDETPNPGYTGNVQSQSVAVVRTTPVEISTWPVVHFIFEPGYVVWRSSWYWGYYPGWWHPWRPYYWHYYYGYHYHWFPEYYRHYHHYDRPRYEHWNDFYYTGKRVHSPVVSTRIKAGDYKITYSRPEQRKEGEALYSRVHAERPSSISTGNNQGRRADSQSGNAGRYNAPNGNSSRRSDGNIINNSGSNRNAGQNNGNAYGNSRRTNSSNGAIPRSTTTVNNRANTNSAAGQSTVNNRSTGNSNAGGQGSVNRSTGNPNAGGQGSVNRSTGNPNTGFGSNNGSRRSETMNTRTTSKPASVQRVESGRTSGQPGGTVKTSGRRSSEPKSQSSASSKKSSTAKENSNSSRRK